jgi:hypothetical protein
MALFLVQPILRTTFGAAPEARAFKTVMPEEWVILVLKTAMQAAWAVVASWTAMPAGLVLAASKTVCREGGLPMPIRTDTRVGRVDHSPKTVMGAEQTAALTATA